MNCVIIRDCHEGDFDRLLGIWRAVDFNLGVSDTLPELTRFLERNPTTCLVAELDGLLVGGVLGGFDGRRGIVHHLAVAPEFQGRGYGRELLECVVERFSKLGVVKINLWVESRNRTALDFYSHLGWEIRDLTTVSRQLMS